MSMASLTTRSSRRSEGLATKSGNMVAMIDRGNKLNRHAHHNQSNINSRKRARYSMDSDEHLPHEKRRRLVIEIESKINPLQRNRSVVIKPNANSDVATSAKSTEPPQIVTPPDVPTTLPTPRDSLPQPTKHQSKVANGIKHELNRLQVKGVDIKDEKRKLRSQEGTKFKSDLSQYFPEYDEVVGNVPKEEHFLNADTPIIVIDSAKPSRQLSFNQKIRRKNNDYAVKSYPSSLFYDLHDAYRIDFSDTVHDDEAEDPLSEERFKSLHRRPERHEKALRNADKGRAQHEKDQVIRLMEGLQGPDWLRVLGVSGITDSRKKEFEPARQYFIRGCESIIEKFRMWKDEEKRRKLEKEQAIADAQDDDDDDDVESNGDPPDYSDIDASAARQLHDEAIARSSSRRRTTTESVIPPLPVPEREFKSFFAKPYLREAALGKHRRSGRSVAAWGHPVPDVLDADFDLPEEYRDEETLKIRARRKRRDRRMSKE
ncbi:IQ calmodulin-binding domain-containing protein [Rutstroemia sp. NJR-2017a BBW]|nr:IQ calmodulin-binding domain-containing protein [Rutstroemia sp. NJR-2017a BBW]